MDMDEALQTFLVECRELLQDMESALLAIETTEDKSDLVNAIFRAAHTIKGSSGLFRLDHIVAFTHVLESVLDQVRAGKLVIADAMVGLLLSCCDHIGALIGAVAEGHTEPDPALSERGEPLVAQLKTYLSPSSAPTVQRALSEQESQAVQRIAGPGVASDSWHISVRFGRDVLRNGMDPLSFVRYLTTFGKITGIVTLSDALPAADEMDPESCYLAFEIAFKSDASKEKIEKVFEFVRDDSQLRIIPPHSRIEEYIHLIENQPMEPQRVGTMLVRCGTLTELELKDALKSQETHPEKAVGTILVEQGVVDAAVVDAALTKQKVVRETVAQESRSIRVDADKLDHLINLVGELIIAGANVNMIAHRAQIAELEASTSKMSTLVQEVRDSALQLRMVKIGATFNRFQRVVHDVSRELGKDIALAINGEDTELDKTVVEKIGDPLMHLVRNAMDHGIEAAELRQARKKPAQGTVRLNAFHDSGSIAITVEDDGGGLNRQRILNKAVERGLVEAGHHLSDGEIYGLIFEPGFSTAEKVTNLSGRGVGLDVVKRNITSLRGTVAISSEEGVGTRVTVRLPLTLAIIDGFLVGVNKAVYAIPLEMIEECVAYSAEPGRNYTNLRGQVLPFIRLRELFNLKGQPARGENIVVLRHGQHKAGLVVDTLMGEFQTVIKPLGEVFSQVKCISGSTILGSGEVALILDVPALISRCIQQEPQLNKLNDAPALAD